MELQLRMPAVRIQFVFLQQTAAGRQKIAAAEQEQRTGSGRSGILARRRRKNLERERRHLVGDSLLHWQPVKRPEKWFSVGSK